MSLLLHFFNCHYDSHIRRGVKRTCEVLVCFLLLFVSVQLYGRSIIVFRHSRRTGQAQVFRMLAHPAISCARAKVDLTGLFTVGVPPCLCV